MNRSLAVLVVALLFALLPSGEARAQPLTPGAAPFLGTWCAQGLRARHASIVANGAFLTLTNEQGSTSPGHILGISNVRIVADGWGFVAGTLSPDGKTLSWSNGTFWARCAGHAPVVDVEGTWYANGDRSRPCRIEQNGARLTLRNEAGQTATGRFTGRRTLATVWSGTPVGGTVARTQNRIVWDNGTFWTR